MMDFTLTRDQVFCNKIQKAVTNIKKIKSSTKKVAL